MCSPAICSSYWLCACIRVHPIVGLIALAHARERERMRAICDSPSPPSYPSPPAIFFVEYFFTSANTVSVALVFRSRIGAGPRCRFSTSAFLFANNFTSSPSKCLYHLLLVSYTRDTPPAHREMFTFVVSSSCGGRRAKPKINYK